MVGARPARVIATLRSIQERATMTPKALRYKTTVLPGGKVEFVSPKPEAGQTVDVCCGQSNTA